MAMRDPHLTNLKGTKFVCWFHRYTRDIPELAPFFSWHGAQIGGLRVFLVIKKSCGLSTASAAVLSMMIKTCKKMPHSAQRSWTHLFCVCFCMWSAKPRRSPS